MGGRVGSRVCVACVMLATSLAQADGLADPPAGPGLPPAPQTGPSPPTAEPLPGASQAAPPIPNAVTAAPSGVYGQRYGRIVERSGPVVLGGVISSGGDTAWRVDAILPIPRSSAPQLRAGVELVYNHVTADTPVLAFDVYGFAIVPCVFYDFRLPITNGVGDFVVSIEGGAGVAIGRVKVDAPYMPGNFETIVAYTIRVATALQFRARNGAVVSLQLLGLDVPLNQPESPSPHYEVSTDLAFTLAFMAGFQFR